MPRVNPPLSPRQKAQICALYAQGFDVKILAQRYGRHEKTIQTMLENDKN